jgi:hypothetical protein
MDGMHLEDKYQLVPYWDKTIPECIRADRVKEFERAVFPIWAGIMGREKEKKDECAILHGCDIAIHGSGIRVFRGPIPDGRKERAMHLVNDVYAP